MFLNFNALSCQNNTFSALFKLIVPWKDICIVRQKLMYICSWIFTCRRKRRSRGSNFQHSRAPDFSVKLNFLHVFHISTILATISAALCGYPAHALCRASSHTNVMSSAGQHTYSSQLNSWNSPRKHEQADLSLYTPKSAPANLRSACTAHTPSAGSRSSRCGNL